VDRLLLAAGLTAVVVAVAVIAHRTQAPRSISAPGTQGWSLPQHLDRASLPHPDAPWLLAVFWSATCDTCTDVLAHARRLAAADLAVVDVEYGEQRAVHERYGIEAVPAVAVVDHDGGVRDWILGPVTAEQLAGAVQAARRPAGSADPPPSDPPGEAEVGWPRRGPAGPPAEA
jgi:hypothetical protein